MQWLGQIFMGLLLLAALPLWSQDDNSAAVQPGFGALGQARIDDVMLTPAPVGGQFYPTQVTSEERSNYLRAGVVVTGAYTDNVLGSATTHPVSDESYSVGPTLALDETRSRLHLAMTYAPGFTFYEHTSSRNEADQNAAIDVTYRPSPRVTLSGRDGFLKSSNVFNQLTFTPAVSGAAQQPNFSVIAPIASILSNSGNVEITYQFAANGTVGASGTFTNLHYLNQAQVPGLFDSNSQGGSAFYTHRLSKMHYIGATYQYQRLISYLTVGQSETETHALLLYYTLYASPKLSFSFFGGPQHAETVEPASQFPSVRSWTPAAGASMSWQGRLNSFAISYSRVISGGGGLVGAVDLNSASASIRQRFSKTLSGTVAVAYAQSDLLASALATGTNGHTVSGTASLQREFGQHIDVLLGYARLHMNYSTVAVLAATPDTNREFVTISYQFSRPLGR